MKWPEELNFMKNRNAVQKESTTSMKGKRTLISGATSGVGLSAAFVLAEAGSDLILLCRNHEKALPIQEKLINQFGVQVDIVVADFSDLDAVSKAAHHILKAYERIDVLINSVGIHSTRKRLNKDGMELCFVVNHLGPFLLTELLLPKMKESAPSRIIQVNSEGHRFSSVHLNDLHFKKRLYTGLRSYGQSKTAQLLSMMETSKQLEGTKVTINACHPGGVKTAIGSNNGFLYRFFFKHVTSKFLKDPIISGKALYYLASDPKMEGVTGRFFNLTIDEVPAKHARDPKLSHVVYKKSLELVGLTQ